MVRFERRSGESGETGQKRETQRGLSKKLTYQVYLMCAQKASAIPKFL
jgi:hypothetical protein